MDFKPAALRNKLPRPVAIALAVIGVVLIGLLGWQVMKPKAPKEPFRIEAVQRGPLTRSVSASGTLQALVTVQVGSQLSGQVLQVNADFNDRVKRGQVLAVLDPQTYVSRVAQGQAEVGANVASVNQQQAQAEVARSTYERTKYLYDRGIMAKAALETDMAAWKAAQAAVASAQARTTQARAALNSTRVELGRTTIVAPIDGVIVDRQIEPGQTVAASLSAPILFQIAQDMSRLQVKITVDEADIGQVKEGQPIRFTVDAFPDENFTGVVTQVRKQPETEQNVVAYIVMAEAENPGEKLLPGMTANADIIIEERRNVLKVPAAALRWTPADQRAPVRAPGGFGGPPGGGQGANRQGGQGGQGGGANRLIEQLDLDAKQAEQVRAIFQDSQRKAQAGVAAGDRQARRQAMAKARQDALTRIEPLLKPAQKAKLPALRATMAAGGGRAPDGMTPGVVWVLRDDKPTAVSVMVGGTDGSYTEVRGPLKAGDQVITGGGPKPKVKAADPLGGAPAPRIRM